MDGDAADFVFDTHLGKMLLNPTIEAYHKYWYDGLSFVGWFLKHRRIKKIKWQSRLEKILVDLLADDLRQGILSHAELPAIYEDAFRKYVIDESSLFCHAKRRGAEKNIRQFIKERTNVRLRLG